jgi:peptidyl-prolyl cis-trans isomerase SurA
VKIFKICVALIVTFMSATAGAEVVDKVVALVNDEIITMSELNSAFESYRKRIEESYKNQNLEKVMTEARVFVLNRLIDQNLVEQQAKKTGIVIKDDEVMDTIKEYLEKRKITMADFLISLAKDRSSIEEYKKDIRSQLATMRLVRRDIKSKIAVGEDEIGAYYLKHREDYEGKEAVRIKQIMIPFPNNVDPATKADMKRGMDVIYKRLKGGESFDMLASVYSKGPAAGANGDIGFVERGIILPVVEHAAFNLQKDEISDVIESPIGFHIIKVVDRRGAGIQPLESVRLEIQGKIEDEKMEKKYAEWITELRNKSHIEINL